MEKWMDALLMLIPVLAVIAVVYLMLRQYFDQQRLAQEKDWREKKLKQYLPAQIQAYERLLLYLERTHPERLVFRVNKPGMSARLMMADMLKMVREEFDHNLTQQLYISSEAWESIKAAREESIKLLNRAAEMVHKDATSMEYSAALLELMDKVKKAPTDVAAEILKAEFRRKMKA